MGVLTTVTIQVLLMGKIIHLTKINTMNVSVLSLDGFISGGMSREKIMKHVNQQLIETKWIVEAIGVTVQSAETADIEGSWSCFQSP